MFLHIVDFEIACAILDALLDENTGEGRDLGEVVRGFSARVAPETDEGFYSCGVYTEPLEVEGLENLVGVEDGVRGSSSKRCGGVSCCGEGELVVEKGGYCCRCFGYRTA